MTRTALVGVLYALSRIGDHVEALAAYRALAYTYPEHADLIEQAYKRDQCDWWLTDDYLRYFPGTNAIGRADAQTWALHHYGVEL